MEYGQVSTRQVAALCAPLTDAPLGRLGDGPEADDHASVAKPRKCCREATDAGEADTPEATNAPPKRKSRPARVKFEPDPLVPAKKKARRKAQPVPNAGEVTAAPVAGVLEAEACASSFVLGDPPRTPAQQDTPALGERFLCNIYDPFGMSDPEPDDVPFDAPDEAGFRTPEGDDEPPLAIPECGPALGAHAETRRSPEPVTQSDAVQSNARPLQPEYLAKARKAVQAQSIPKKQRTFFDLLVGEQSGVALSVTASITAPVMLASAWVILDYADGASAPAPRLAAAASAAAVPVRAPAAEDPAVEYQAALMQIEAGRVGEGVSLLQRLADAGYPMAQYRLAKLHEHGEGVQRSLTLARQWAERAASAGNCRAMHDVGVYFARGEGAPLDEAAAFRWFREAAEFGVADSQYNLGVLYQQGRGVGANSQEALFWFLLAAHQHDVNAVDHAVEIAARLSPAQVEQALARARAFQPRPADAAANGLSGCAGAQRGA